MKAVSKGLYPVMIGIPVLTLVVLLITRPPLWAGILLQLCAIGAVAALLGVRRVPMRIPLAEGPPAVNLVEVSLPSVSADTRFQFSAVVHWSPLRRPAESYQADLSAIASDAILARAAQVTAMRRPEDSDLVQHRLGAALGAGEPDASELLIAWAGDVQVTLADNEQRHLANLSELRKQIDCFELEAGKERKLRDYVRNDILRSPGSVMSWWLAKHQEELAATVDLEPVFQALVAMAADKRLPAKSGTTSGDACRLESALELAKGASQADLADDLAGLWDDLGQPDDADRIRRKYGLGTQDARVFDFEQGHQLPDQGGAVEG